MTANDIISVSTKAVKGPEGRLILAPGLVRCGPSLYPSKLSQPGETGWHLGKDILAHVRETSYCKPLREFRSGSLACSNGQKTLIRLGASEYSLEDKVLSDASGNPVFLRPKTLDVLDFLISKNGSLASRNEILDAVWQNVSVSDDSLTQCISEIRRALGDSGKSVLKTVSKRGYQLWFSTSPAPMAPPRPQRVNHEPKQATTSQDASFGTCVFVAASKAKITQALRRTDFDEAQLHSMAELDGGHALFFYQMNHAVGCAFALKDQLNVSIGLTNNAVGAELQAQVLSDLSTPGTLVVSTGIRDALCSDPLLEFEDIGESIGSRVGDTRVIPIRAFRLVQASQGEASFLARPSNILPTIAVLPLRQGVDGHSAGTLGTMFSVAVTQELSRSHEVNVISSMSTSSFLRQGLDLEDIRSSLKADFVLSGFWVEAGAGAQIHYEFSDARTKRVLWSDSLETQQNQVSEFFEHPYLVANHIRRAIVLSETQRVLNTPLESLEDYSILYGAVGMMHRLSPVDFRKSNTLLNVLLEKSSSHPTPLAWKARWHLLKVVQGWSENPDRDSEQAYDCTARALDIDPNHSLALVSEGQVLTHLKRRLDDAEHRYNAALEVNPNDVNGRLLKAMLLAFTDRGKEGLPEAERGLQLSPLDPHRFMNLALAAGVNLSAGNHETAADLVRMSYRLNRTHASTLRMMVVTEARVGNEARARQAVQELLQAQPGLRVEHWLQKSPSAGFQNGQEFAADLRAMGIPG